jgi:uncharacterized protein with PIN domain
MSLLYHPHRTTSDLLVYERRGGYELIRLQDVHLHPAWLTERPSPALLKDLTDWQAAVAAWWRYGKGRHRAAVNFGDCLAYATATVAGESLLAKGDDFTQTDVPLS